jgi:tRNA 5-methylaminomethyl-2-thiouridine biosynthesis bifunctional protein
VGWRATTADRLPLVGALPLPLSQLQAAARPVRLEQPRLIPRRQDANGGLYVISGLGSRGITWAALAARLLAHWVAGSPCPVEADLRDALDPARWLSRQASRQQADISR